MLLTQVAVCKELYTIFTHTSLAFKWKGLLAELHHTPASGHWNYEKGTMNQYYLPGLLCRI